MGLISGVLLEKCKADSPSILNKKAAKFVLKVPESMQSVVDYAKINSLLDQISAELGQS